VAQAILEVRHRGGLHMARLARYIWPVKVTGDLASSWAHRLDNCWTLAGNAITRVTASGSVRGHDVHCALACRQTGREVLWLEPSGQYRLPSGALACPVGAQVQFPDEVGVVRPGRRGKLLLQPTNRCTVD
jgi:hypothetical protein